MSNDPTIKVQPTGVRGFQYYGRETSWVDEEWLSQLTGLAGVRAIREMRDNDAVIGAACNMTMSHIRQVPWHARAADNSPEAREEADFLDTVIRDMSHTWDEAVSEIVSHLWFGWALFEKTYKRRTGGKVSAYNDGRVGIEEFALRAQETLDDWKFDERGNVVGMYQRAAPKWERVLIPMTKAVLFRTESNKGSPEGRSLLRNAYRSWYFLKRLQELEAIGIERDLVGLPVIELPPSYMEANASAEKKAAYATYKTLLQQIRRNDHEGIIFPSEIDRDGKPTQFKLRLLTSGGQRQTNPGEPIRRYEQRIAMVFNTGFQFLGLESSASNGAADDMTEIYATAMRAVLDNMEDTINRFLVRELFELNGVPVERMPRLVHGEVKRVDIARFADAMLKLSDARILTRGPDLEAFTRQQMGLPPLTDQPVSPLPDPGATQEDPVLDQREEAREQARAGGQVVPSS